MEFLAQVSAAAQHATGNGTLETVGIVGVSGVAMKVIEIVAQKIPPFKGRGCSWRDTSAAKAAEVLTAVDEDGRPRVFVPRSLERNQVEMLKLQRETAQVLKQAATTLDRIAERQCPLGRDIREIRP